MNLRDLIGRIGRIMLRGFALAAEPYATTEAAHIIALDRQPPRVSRAERRRAMMAERKRAKQLAKRLNLHSGC